MIKSKALKIISTFSKEEFSEFEKFLNSPFHNSKIRLQPNLFHYIRKYNSDFNHRNFTKVNLFNELFPGKKYEDSKIRSLLSGLYKLAQEYLSYKNYKNSFDFDYNILCEFNKRHIDNLFELKSKELKKKIEGRMIHDQNYYHDKFVLFNLENDFYQFRDRKKALKVFRPLAENYCYFSLLQFIQIYLLLVSQNKISNFDISFISNKTKKFINDILVYIESEEEIFKSKAPDINLYYNLVQLQLPEGKIYFERIKSYLSKKGTIDNILQNSIYIYLNEYFFLNYNDKSKSLFFRKQKFNIDTLIFRSRRLPFGWPYFPSIPFLNVVRNALKLKKFRWTKEFINRYRSFFENHENEVVVFSHALVKFYEGNPFEADKLVSKIKFKSDSNIANALRILKIMICYELDKTEEAICLIKSDLRWIYRKDDLRIAKARAYKSNLKYFERLVEFKSMKKTYKGIKCIKKFHKFSEEVNNTNYFYEKDWLVEKTKDLEKFYSLKKSSTLLN